MSLLSAVADFLKPEPPLDPRVADGLRLISELIDPRLPQVGGFHRHLREPLQHALGYCDGLVAALPGPIPISRNAFASDPLVHALFATADDIDQMLGRSQAIRDFLQEPCSWEGEQFYALFAARRREKHQLGLGLIGEVVRGDVPQTLLYFSDHTLIEPHCSLDETKQHLRMRALESLLKSFHDHVEALRHEREGLRADLSVERAHLTILRGKSPGPEYEICTRHLAEVEQQLRQTAESLMPEPLVSALGHFLASPEPSLSLRTIHVCIDRLGVVCPDEPDRDDIHSIDFPELITRDQRLHTVVLACIDREEARQAVERVNDLQHRFMLI